MTPKVGWHRTEAPEMILPGDTERENLSVRMKHKPIYSNILFQSIIYSYSIYPLSLEKCRNLYDLPFQKPCVPGSRPKPVFWRCERGDSRAQEVPAERWRPKFSHPRWCSPSYNLPSGKHTKSYWKWPSRNSWFTNEKWWCSIVFCMFTRVFQDSVSIWLVVCNIIFMTFHILGITIPTDELIFFRGVETMNQID